MLLPYFSTILGTLSENLVPGEKTKAMYNEDDEYKPGLLLTEWETIRYLGIGRAAFRRWVSDGTIPPSAILRDGKRCYFKRLALDEWAR